MGVIQHIRHSARSVKKDGQTKFSLIYQIQYSKLRPYTFRCHGKTIIITIPTKQKPKKIQEINFYLL